jgi:CRISPR system Cascade subunit CasB
MTTPTATSAPPRTQRAQRAVASLTRDTTTRTGELLPALLKRPGARADLKRCLGQRPDSPAWDRAWGHLIAYLPEQSVPDQHLTGPAVLDEQRAFVTVAAMICAQPPAARSSDLQRAPATADRPRNLGASLAAGVTGPHTHTRESGLHRLILLSRQNTDGIHRLLPGTVQHLRGNGVDVDWVRLIGDLADWRRRRRDIARWWIQDYHRNLHSADPERAQTEPTATESETA